MKTLFISLATAMLCFAAATAMADPPAASAVPGSDTIRDFIIAHKDAKVMTMTPHQKQYAVIESIGQDHFCERFTGGSTSQTWCIPFAHIVYYTFENNMLVISFEHPY